MVTDVCRDDGNRRSSDDPLGSPKHAAASLARTTDGPEHIPRGVGSGGCRCGTRSRTNRRKSNRPLSHSSGECRVATDPDEAVGDRGMRSPVAVATARHQGDAIRDPLRRSSGICMCRLMLVAHAADGFPQPPATRRDGRQFDSRHDGAMASPSTARSPRRRTRARWCVWISRSGLNESNTRS